MLPPPARGACPSSVALPSRPPPNPVLPQGKRESDVRWKMCPLIPARQPASARPITVGRSAASAVGRAILNRRGAAGTARAGPIGPTNGVAATVWPWPCGSRGRRLEECKNVRLREAAERMGKIENNKVNDGKQRKQRECAHPALWSAFYLGVHTSPLHPPSETLGPPTVAAAEVSRTVIQRKRHHLEKKKIMQILNSILTWCRRRHSCRMNPQLGAEVSPRPNHPKARSA